MSVPSLVILPPDPLAPVRAQSLQVSLSRSRQTLGFVRFESVPSGTPSLSLSLSWKSRAPSLLLSGTGNRPTAPLGSRTSANPFRFASANVSYRPSLFASTPPASTTS